MEQTRLRGYPLHAWPGALTCSWRVHTHGDRHEGARGGESRSKIRPAAVPGAAASRNGSVLDATDGLTLDSALRAWTGGRIDAAASQKVFAAAAIGAGISYIAQLSLAVADTVTSRRGT